jgi:hypothetical protein
VEVAFTRHHVPDFHLFGKKTVLWAEKEQNSLDDGRGVRTSCFDKKNE